MVRTDPGGDGLSHRYSLHFYLWRIGVWDDRSELDYKFKFFGQSIGVLLLVFIGDVKIMYLAFLGLVRYRITLPYPFDVSQTYIRFS